MSGKHGTIKNAGVENAGVEKRYVYSRGGKASKSINLAKYDIRHPKTSIKYHINLFRTQILNAQLSQQI